MSIISALRNNNYPSLWRMILKTLVRRKILSNSPSCCEPSSLRLPRRLILRNDFSTIFANASRARQSVVRFVPFSGSTCSWLWTAGADGSSPSESPLSAWGYFALLCTSGSNPAKQRLSRLLSVLWSRVHRLFDPAHHVGSFAHRFVVLVGKILPSLRPLIPRRTLHPIPSTMTGHHPSHPMRLKTPSTTPLISFGIIDESMKAWSAFPAIYDRNSASSG